LIKNQISNPPELSKEKNLMEKIYMQIRMPRAKHPEKIDLNTENKFFSIKSLRYRRIRFLINSSSIVCF